MNIQLTDSHIREHVKTKATPQEIAKYLSLCGPSVESLTHLGKDYIYNIEVTTNRVDMMSARGIAREASAILPRFGIKAKLLKEPFQKPKVTDTLNLPILPNPKLVSRIMAVAITDLKNWKSPSWLTTRLEAAGIRSLNAVIDITNYVMLDLGHPTHVFDYDQLLKGSLVVRESKKGEQIIGLDQKLYTLAGGDIVFDNGKGEIIDLPGILGTKNSVVNSDTKSIIFFIDNNDPVRIRHTSMSLGIRTMAAVLNEKGVDPHLGADALQKGIKLYQKICGARVVSKIYDNFPAKPKPKKVTVTKNKIDQTLGVTLPKTKILSYLTSLNFLAHWETDNLIVTPPTWRVKDINIPEDIIEEIARIYGYHNLPSHLMDGPLPQSIYKPGVRFTFIETLKQQLKSLGGTEVLTLSLTGKAQTDKNALKLKNPLGRGTEYLRTSLKPSLMAVTKENLGWQDPYHIFEIANTYHPRKGDLPEERLTLAGLYHGYEFRRAKGAIEHLLSTSLTNYSFIEKDDRTLTITTHKKDLGTIDASDLNNIYYEININTAQLSCSKDNIIKNIPKHPPHIEDITVSLPASKKIGELINLILQSNELIKQVELKDIYKRAHTLRIYYQHPDKTLTGKEVERLRNSVEKAIEKLTHSK